jgi:hypothetical protein
MGKVPEADDDGVPSEETDSPITVGIALHPEPDPAVATLAGGRHVAGDAPGIDGRQTRDSAGGSIHESPTRGLARASAMFACNEGLRLQFID